MYPATVTRFLFYFIWTLFLIPQVIKSVNPIEHQVNQLSRSKRHIKDGTLYIPYKKMMRAARSKAAGSRDRIKENIRSHARLIFDPREAKHLERELELTDIAAIEVAPEIDTRIGPANSQESTSETTRKALPMKDNDDDDSDSDGDDDDDDTDEETRRAADSDENDDREARRQAAPLKLHKLAEKDPEAFWKKIMQSAMQRAIQQKVQNGELQAKVEPRITTGGSKANDDGNSNDETNSSSMSDAGARRAAQSVESDEETRRSQDKSSEEGSDEETRRAADNSEEEDEDAVGGTRRRADAAEGDSGATEDETEDEEGTRKATTKLEGSSDGSSRRFQKNVNVNQNVNTNINSNAQIDPMAYPRDEEYYRPRYQPDAKLSLKIPDDIYEKLHACDVFRDNIIVLMGYLLRLPDGQLSSHEYSSLELIYNALKSKNVYMYNTLPSLRSLRDKRISQQFIIALDEIGRNLPAYMKSAAKFWIKRIQKGRIKLDSILSRNPKIQILAGIPHEAFSISRRDVTGEISAINHGSRLTEELMGPIYVSLFELLDGSHENLTQKLFGTLLQDLPNARSDPVHEEYVRYISEEATKNRIPNWSRHCENFDAKNPYRFVVSLIDDICADSDVSLQMKKAFLYIRHHFTDSGRRVRRNVVSHTRSITENGIDIDKLLKVVVPYQTDDIDEMKFRLRRLIFKNPRDDVKRILEGINRYRYNSPKDLLLALLARLQMRLPENDNVQIVASAFLSNLLFPTVVNDISAPENGAIAFWLLVDSIMEPNTNETVKELFTSLQEYLFKDLSVWDVIQSQLIPNRYECTYPRKCLLTVLEKLRRVMKREPNVLPKKTRGIVGKLLTYVAKNLVQKNTPYACKDTASTWPMLDSSSTSDHHSTKMKKPYEPTVKPLYVQPEYSRSTPFPSKSKTKSSKTTQPSKFIQKVSTSNEPPHKIKSKPLKIALAFPKTTLNPSAITYGHLTEKPGKKETSVSEKNIKPTKSTSEPPTPSNKLTTKSKQSQKTPDSLGRSPDSSSRPTMPEETSQKPTQILSTQPQIVTMPGVVTTNPGKVTTGFGRVTTGPGRLTSVPSRISTEHLSESDSLTQLYQPTQKLLMVPKSQYGFPTTIKKLRTTSGTSKKTSTKLPLRTTKNPKSTSRPSQNPSVSSSQATRKPTSRDKPKPSTAPLLTTNKPKSTSALSSILSTHPKKIADKSKSTLKPSTLSSGRVSSTSTSPQLILKSVQSFPIRELNPTKLSKVTTQPLTPLFDVLMNATTSPLRPAEVVSGDNTKSPKERPMLPGMTTEISKSKPQPTRVMTSLPKTTRVPKKINQLQNGFSDSLQSTTQLPKLTTALSESTTELFIPKLESSDGATLSSSAPISVLPEASSQPLQTKSKTQYKNKASQITTQTLKITTKEPEPDGKPLESGSAANVSNSTSKIASKTTRLVFSKSTAPPTKSATIPNETTSMSPLSGFTPPIVTTSDDSISKRSLLPPGMRPYECIVFVPKSNKLDASPSVHSQDNVSTVPANAVVFPSMIELQADLHDDTKIIDNVNQACVHELMTDIIPKLNNTMHGSYETVLLGGNWREYYPTRISALMGILKKALRHPKVIAQPALRRRIRKYRDGLQFIAPYIYLPLLSRWKKFNGEIIWSSIDSKNHDFSVVANAPPKEIEKDIITLPIINPSYWNLPVDSKTPLRNLLPRLPANGKYAEELKPLTEIFTLKKLKTVINGPVNFSAFRDRGTLLMHTLIQLKYNKKIQKDTQLFRLVKRYLKILQRPAMYIRIPQEIISTEHDDVSSGWRVDTVDLIDLLPTPKSAADTKFHESMKNFLARQDLLSELKIPIPPMETTKGAFLKTIINKALQMARVVKEDMIRRALKYYQDKIDNDRGKMNLGWIWSQKFIVSTEMHLGELIKKLIPYDELSLNDKRAYDDLLAYFTNHPHFLKTHSMPLTEYKSQGKFLRGFFEHLLEDPSLESNIKEKVKKLLPSVKITGEGEKSLPPLARKALPLVTPTW